MKILMRDDAAKAYVQRCYKGARADCGMLHRPEFADMLRAVQGQWIEVETDHLFRDQFNTVPIPGVSDNGLRVMVNDIQAIEDDVRQGVVKCNWCYGYDHDKDGACDKCGKTEYLEPLNPISPV